MKTITTVMGDTWDTVALRAYGNVLRTQELMEARENVRLLDIEVFPGGVVVFVPDVTDTYTAGDLMTGDLPEWRK